MTKLFRLTINVLVDLNDTTELEMKSRLEDIPRRISVEGLFTGESDAEVVEYGYTVTQPKSIEDTA